MGHKGSVLSHSLQSKLTSGASRRDLPTADLPYPGGLGEKISGPLDTTSVSEKWTLKALLSLNQA